jgi:hypothetical protein
MKNKKLIIATTIIASASLLCGCSARHTRAVSTGTFSSSGQFSVSGEASESVAGKTPSAIAVTLSPLSQDEYKARNGANCFTDLANSALIGISLSVTFADGQSKALGLAYDSVSATMNESYSFTGNGEVIQGGGAEDFGFSFTTSTEKSKIALTLTGIENGAMKWSISGNATAIN